MRAWKYILCLIIVLSNPSPQSTSYVYQMINGTINNSTTINFTVVARSLQGVILHSFDTLEKQLGVEVTGDRHKERRLIFSFDKVAKVENLNTACGCSPCEDAMLHFSVTFLDVVRLSCNNHAHLELPGKYANGRDGSKGDENADTKQYPLPAAVVNDNTTTMIMIGNLGPYETANGSTVFPVRPQMIGCLKRFTYNEALIAFLGGDDRVEPSCQMPCDTGPCNGGVCRDTSRTESVCDCRSTALNGPFCNRSLTRYERAAADSYEVRGGARPLHVKMTWKRLLDRGFCLLEFVTGDGRVTVWVSKDRLWVDSEAVGAVSADGVDFVSVTMAADHSIIRTSRDSSKTLHSINDAHLINVGFSGGANICATFEGAYDLHLDPPLRARGARTPWSPPSATTTVNIPWLAIVCPVILLCFLGSIAFVVFVYRRNIKKMKTELVRTATRSCLSLPMEYNIFTEDGVYGKVTDNTDYDYLEDSGIYATVVT